MTALLGWHSQSFRTWMYRFRLFWLSEFALRNQVLFWWVFLYIGLVFFVLQFSIVFLCSVYLVFLLWYTTGCFFFGLVQLGFFYLYGYYSLSFGKFSCMVLIKIYSMSWDSFPSSMPLIGTFHLLMISLISCIFLSHAFKLFHFLWLFCLGPYFFFKFW